MSEVARVRTKLKHEGEVERDLTKINTFAGATYSVVVVRLTV